jgi:hypothetical protein
MNSTGGCRGTILSHAIEEIACCVRCEGIGGSCGLSGRLSDLARRVADLDCILPDTTRSTMLDLAAEVYEASTELLAAGWLIGSLALEGIEGKLIETLLEGVDPCPSTMPGVRVLTSLGRQAHCTGRHENPPLGGRPWVPKRRSS